MSENVIKNMQKRQIQIYKHKTEEYIFGRLRMNNIFLRSQFFELQEKRKFGLFGNDFSFELSGVSQNGGLLLFVSESYL